MRYNRGDYVVLLFGEYGEKLGKKSAESLKAAEAKGDAHDQTGYGFSHVVTRVIKNSKDANDKWEYTE